MKASLSPKVFSLHFPCLYTLLFEVKIKHILNWFFNFGHHHHNTAILISTAQQMIVSSDLLQISNFLNHCGL